VAYVDGDTDGNELLTGSGDLFETGPPETWHFTCTTTVDVDTTNTVTAIGTPTGPQGALGPDVTDTDTAFVNVVQLGSITIVKDVRGGEDGTFSFAGDLGPFTVETTGSTGTTTFADVRPGTYRIEERTAAAWMLMSISCDDPTDDSASGGSAATIDLAEAESVTCTFTNARVPNPPGTAIGSVGGVIPPIQGTDLVRAGSLVIVGLLGAIAALAVRARRRGRVVRRSRRVA
jgi:hypothetical protein